MAHSIDLGQANFRSYILDLNLMLHASVELFYERVRSSVQTQNLEQLIQSAELWIIQAPEVKMHLITTGDQTLPMVAVFSSLLGDMLCNLRLWSDLDLAIVPRSSNHSVEPHPSDTLRHSFGLRRKTGRSTTTKMTRIPATMRAVSDAAPPPTVVTACLSSITILLEYSSPRQDIPRSFSVESESPPTTRFQRLVASPNNSYTLLDEDFCRESSVMQLGFVDEHGYYDALAFPEELAAIDDNFTQQTKCHSQIYQCFYDLFSKSFHSLFAGCSRRANESDLEDNRLRPLSRLVPSVFSLGYREAISQRSHLIPSIAKSLTFMLKTTENPILQRKIENLRGLNCPQVAATSQSLQTTHVRTAIRTALWKIAQKQLYNPQALRKSNLLDTLDRSFHSHRAVDDDLFLGMGMDELHDTHDIEDQGIYDFDHYIDTSDDSLAFEEDDNISDNISSLLSLDGNGSLDLADMLEHDDTEIDQTWPNQIMLNCFPVKSSDSLDYLPEQLSCRLSISDSEMLVSDFFEDEGSDPPILTHSATSISENLEAIVEDYDFMLCDDY
ncbi:uncharacterized protein ACLA_046290 [Aspergillus clavatus NRRL 1]|uniref:Uncharacterized protein n=1 Tax=Aspergillus clavatus (strain ATCC 1007 / CBS 513.65 / DSM 816 / NCTC 3887 / NRRL 1 / QM 1276 / 107) TaxID=344612 RepID=A1CH09_ASPCL|nr:uncharacterized protein ACLA_046290 [Aspergillus clavatus NRRL 1]EAW10164.1 conserved hypothetical protein [Aspergillus clavatus NRRL 1]